MIGNVVHCIYMGAAIGYAVDLCTTSFGVQPMISSMERVFSVMDENPQGEFETECVPPSIPGEAEGMDAVILENVSFRYNNGSGFENMSARVPERCYFALRGNVGAGKSTLFKVLLGLERKRTGKIQVLSREQDETEVFQWLSCFTYVEQEQQLFRTTVRENILLAEAWDEERFLYVCRVTGLEELLKKLPDGMDMVFVME